MKQKIIKYKIELLFILAIIVVGGLAMTTITHAVNAINVYQGDGAIRRFTITPTSTEITLTNFGMAVDRQGTSTLITSLKVTNTGTSGRNRRAVFSRLQLLEGNTVIATTNLRSGTGGYLFKNFNYIIGAGQDKSLTIKGTLNRNGVASGQTIRVGISRAADIKAFEHRNRRAKVRVLMPQPIVGHLITVR